LHISVLKKVHAFGLPRDGKRDASSYLEDTSCSACKGTGKLDCLIKECHKGQVPAEGSVVIGENQFGPIYGSKTIYVKCRACDKDGYVRCRFCGGKATKQVGRIESNSAPNPTKTRKKKP
jgi:hypothetical protein